MKAIKKSTLREHARLTRKYAETDIFFAKIEVAKELATQAYGEDRAWLAFNEFVGSIVGVYPLKSNCTDEEFEELFRRLGFEIEEGE